MKMSIGAEGSRTLKERDTMSEMHGRNISVGGHYVRCCYHMLHFAPILVSNDLPKGLPLNKILLFLVSIFILSQFVDTRLSELPTTPMSVTQPIEWTSHTEWGFTAIRATALWLRIRYYPRQEQDMYRDALPFACVAISIRRVSAVIGQKLYR